MIETAENKELAIEYLFGELGEAARDLVEERLFEDDEFSLFLAALEKDLIDEYVRGEMDERLHRRFESRYLTSDTRREKIRIARVLETNLFAEVAAEPATPVAAAARGETPKTSFWTAIADFFRAPNLALAGGLAVILLFLLAGGWLLLRRAPNAPEIVRDDNANRQSDSRTPPPAPTPANSPVIENSNDGNENAAPNTANAPENRTAENKSPANNFPTKDAPEKRPTPIARPSEKREETAPALPRPTRTLFATLFSVSRSDRQQTLTVSKNIDALQLTVEHNNQTPFARYRAEIRDQNGDLVFTRDFPISAKNPSRPISLKIKAARLRTGSYELLLSGVSDGDRTEIIKSYDFLIRKN